MVHRLGLPVGYACSDVVSWGSENHVNQMARQTDIELDVMLLSYIGEYASKCNEYESLKFAVISPNNCKKIITLANALQCLKIIVANDANGIKNNSKYTAH